MSGSRASPAFWSGERTISSVRLSSVFECSLDVIGPFRNGHDPASHPLSILPPARTDALLPCKALLSMNESRGTS